MQDQWSPYEGEGANRRPRSYSRAALRVLPTVHLVDLAVAHARHRGPSLPETLDAIRREVLERDLLTGRVTVQASGVSHVASATAAPLPVRGVAGAVGGAS